MTMRRHSFAKRTVECDLKRGGAILECQPKKLNQPMLASAFNFFAERKQSGIETGTGGFQERQGIVGQPDIDGADAILHDDATGVFELGRDREAASDVVIGADGDEAEVEAGIDQGPGDFAHGAISSTDENVFDAVSDGLLREIGGRVFRGGRHDFQAKFGSGKCFTDTIYFFCIGLGVARDGIDD